MIVEPQFVDDRVIDWLLAGDVAIRYPVHRDLPDENRPTCPAGGTRCGHCEC